MDTFKKLYLTDDHVGGSIDTEWETGRLEWVTAALDENAPNAEQAYRQQLGEVVASITGLQGAHPEQRCFDPADGFMVGIEENLEPPIVLGKQTVTDAWRQAVARMRNQVGFDSHMQATAGIRLDALPRLHAGNDPRTVALPHSGRVVQQMALNSRGVLDAVCALGPIGLADAAVLRGWVSQIVQYLIGDVLWQIAPEEQSTAKNVAAFWSKMDLSVARQQLPQTVQTFVKERVPAINKILNQFYGNFIAQWITARNPRVRDPAIDLVPDFIRRVLTDSSDGFSEPGMGAMDILPGGRRGLPIEFRALAAHPAPEQIVDAALEVIAKVRQVNQ